MSARWFASAEARPPGGEEGQSMLRRILYRFSQVLVIAGAAYGCFYAVTLVLLQEEFVGPRANRILLAAEALLLAVWVSAYYFRKRGKRKAMIAVLHAGGCLIFVVAGWVVLPAQVYGRALDRYFALEVSRYGLERQPPASAGEAQAKWTWYQVEHRVREKELAAAEARYNSTNDDLGNKMHTWSLWSLAVVLGINALRVLGKGGG